MDIEICIKLVGSVCFSPNNNTSPLLGSLKEKSGKQLVFVFGLVEVNEL